MKNTEAFRLKFLKSVNLTSSPFLEIKRKRLEKFISDNAHLPVQGTDEWLDVRRFNIGGSEMSVITGDGGFSNIKKLIASKSGLINFTGQLATRWGKMFENCVISNYDTTGHVDSTAGVYLYDNSDEHSDKSILIPVLLFDKTKLHSITLQYIASFIEVHFGQSLLYTIICRNYYGPNQNRAQRNQKHVLVNTFGKVISF